jgi:hypothetical protein
MNATEVSLRDYFIAHAPAEPQPWFRPVLPPEPESIWNDYERDEAPVNFQEIANWRYQREKERLLQWPGAWADEMIKRRAQWK